MTTTTETVADIHTDLIGDSDAVLDRETIEAHYAYALPENALDFDSVAAVKRAVMSSGSHYWDAAAVRMFNATTDRQLYGRRFWVESRRFVDHQTGQADAREYSVAWVYKYDAADMLQVEKLGSFHTLAGARTAAKRLARAVTA